MRVLPPLNALRVFEVAGECLNFTVAAKRLHVTQGAVSRQIRQLEDFLGIHLFNRVSGKLYLTQKGKDLLQVIQGAFSNIETQVAAIRHPNIRQRLNLLTPPTLGSRWLGPRLGQFHQQYPQYEIHLYTKTEEGVSFDAEIHFQDIRHSTHNEKPLFTEQYIAVCNSNLLKQSKHLADHTHQMLHIRHQGDHLPSWQDWLAAAGIVLPESCSPGITMSTQEQVINAAIAGCGFAIVDKNMVNLSLQRGALVQFDPLQVESRFAYFIHLPSGKQGMGKVDVFYEWLTRMTQL